MGRRCGEAADIVGNVKINCVAATPIDLDIFGLRSERVKRARHGEWNLGLLCT